MENIEGSGVFGDVKSAVDGKVETGKDQAQGNVDDKVKEAPNPGAVPDKPVTALQPNAPGQAPGQLDASGAAPKAKGPEEVEQPLQAESQQLDTQMTTAQITPEQLQSSNEPTFQAALQAKTSAQEHVEQALPQYRTKLRNVGLQFVDQHGNSIGAVRTELDFLLLGPSQTIEIVSAKLDTTQVSPNVDRAALAHFQNIPLTSPSDIFNYIQANPRAFGNSSGYRNVAGVNVVHSKGETSLVNFRNQYLSSVVVSSIDVKGGC